MCKYTSIPRWSHEQASNINNFSHIISGSHGKVLCHAVHEGDTKKWQRVTTGKRWFLESINPKWSFILRAGLDIGETGWHLSYNGAWMMNKITGEFFLTKMASHNQSQWAKVLLTDQYNGSYINASHYLRKQCALPGRACSGRAT